MIELIKALTALGITGNVRIKAIDKDRYSVYIDWEYFGIWDDRKKTFVD